MLTFGKQKVINFLNRMLRSGTSPQKLAMSFCVGLYVAFSPFPGLHFVIMFVISWFFRLNFPLVFTVASINNPWTFIPFYSLDYFFGYWLVHEIFAWNPNFCISLANAFGCGKICLVSFFVGGNVLGLSSAIICYPFLVLFLKSFLKSGKADI